MENDTTNTVRIPKMSAFAQDRAIRSLMESYIARLPKDQQTAAVRAPFQELWLKLARYMKKEELMSIGEAFVFAADAHKDQKRHSGEPYVVHTVSVSSILADMGMDIETIQAALLHDVLEDTLVTDDAINERFGQQVLTMVGGVTKLGKLPFKSIEAYQAENLRKMFLVMAKDIRVVLIKLADRLHNMRTLAAHRPDKQMSIARETLEIYAPLAHRLGIYQMKRDLEDLSFKVLDPEMYYEIRRRVRKRLPEREAVIKQAMDILQVKLTEENIAASIRGRPKHFYSIYDKMQRKELSLDQLYDLLALRVIVGTLSECYQALGIVHSLWKPVPGQFDDYIANPKNNMYQSLHTTILGPTGEPLEVQIRTSEMHSLAEYGIAAHWQYKEGAGKEGKIDSMDKRLTWIRQALESQVEGSDSLDSADFLDRLKTDVLSNEVLAYTPKGDVISVPTGSTPIDFAYAVHTQVGQKCVGAMVNGRIVSMDYTLADGDIVRVLTSPQGKPSRDWLKIAKSNKAKTKIKAYFRALDRGEREEKLSRGKELLEKELKRRAPDGSLALEDVMPQINNMAHDMGYTSGEDVIASVGTGHQTAGGVLSRLDFSRILQLQDNLQNMQDASQNLHGYHKEIDTEIVVDGSPGVQVTLSKCCYPIPGDAITGTVTQNRGITIHRADCSSLTKKDHDRIVSVAWGRAKRGKYIAGLSIEGAQKRELLPEITSAITTLDGSIIKMNASLVNNTRSKIGMEIGVQDLEHLYRIIGRLNAVSGVLEVVRG